MVTAVLDIFSLIFTGHESSQGCRIDGTRFFADQMIFIRRSVLRRKCEI